MTYFANAEDLPFSDSFPIPSQNKSWDPYFHCSECTHQFGINQQNFTHTEAQNICWKSLEH